MEVLIIYCHPSDNSFTARVKDEFIKGLVAAGHQYTLVDLYQENFNETFSEQEYTREAFYNDEMSISEDVKAYHKLINEADILTFIYKITQCGKYRLYKDGDNLLFENKQLAQNAYIALKDKYQTYICTSYNVKKGEMF